MLSPLSFAEKFYNETRPNFIRLANVYFDHLTSDVLEATRYFDEIQAELEEHQYFTSLESVQFDGVRY